MANFETQLICCIQKVSNKISGSEYLQELLKDGRKFEGWFQIELACCLNEKMKEKSKKGVLVEHHVGDNRHADVFIENEKGKGVAIEIKFIVKGKAITDARKSLLNQMHQNAIKHHSYGAAVLVAENDISWFQDESDRIETYCKDQNYNISIDPFDYSDGVFCIKLLKHH